MVHIFGQDKSSKKAEPKNYTLRFRITDRQMKPERLAFEKTSERVNWLEDVTVDEATSDTEAVLGATFALSKTWSPSIYDIECVSVSEQMVQVPKMILP